ncbi:hypothetical protein BDK51DRAFT_43654 [Blyttiomyces helicus]|uniref:Uncharacterized protein n=1 Tax=Blyttiomyces helicus TaxID=388810 RepID=A0A4P9WK47_9FUNG|nr:hypothetical protein BDK51DRAFT_43654 [Blyttiomyces helicus]|eukprot:RKO93331.1 hypothetical protein BDK51DRAFT_43654 [Blyttiomyces helicus]
MLGVLHLAWSTVESLGVGSRPVACQLGTLPMGVLVLQARVAKGHSHKISTCTCSLGRSYYSVEIWEVVVDGIGGDLGPLCREGDFDTSTWTPNLKGIEDPSKKYGVYYSNGWLSGPICCQCLARSAIHLGYPKKPAESTEELIAEKVLSNRMGWLSRPAAWNAKEVAVAIAEKLSWDYTVQWSAAHLQLDTGDTEPKSEDAKLARQRPEACGQANFQARHSTVRSRPIPSPHVAAAGGVTGAHTNIATTASATDANTVEDSENYLDADAPVAQLKLVTGRKISSDLNRFHIPPQLVDIYSVSLIKAVAIPLDPEIFNIQLRWMYGTIATVQYDLKFDVRPPLVNSIEQVLAINQTILAPLVKDWAPSSEIIESTPPDDRLNLGPIPPTHVYSAPLALLVSPTCVAGSGTSCRIFAVDLRSKCALIAAGAHGHSWQEVVCYRVAGVR